MKKLLAVLLSTFAAQAFAQSLESDLDGNASALQASEMRPQPPRKAVARADAKRAPKERVASR